MGVLGRIRRLLAPAPHVERLPAEQVRKRYPRLRWAILESTFVGYACFYLVRNNLSTVSKDIEGALHYDHNMIGNILALTAIAYGLGKFLMGAVSDRSNPRLFMPLGLLLTAACNFAFGSVQSYPVHLALWSLNGFVQGMGWPPCGRSMGHWFAVRERGSIFAVWNIAHNVGGGLAGVLAAWATSLWGWTYAFYVPAVLAVACAVYLFVRLRDTPQSVGLPPVEEYKQDYIAGREGVSHEQELSTRELFVRYILTNKLLWLVALANFFVYVVRYSMLDWGPMYLREVKGASLEGGGVAVLVVEFGGIPSTLLMGWLSDRLGGRRGMVSLLCMIPILLAFAGILLNPPGRLWLDMTLLAVVGFFVYPPVMLLGVSALDLTSKKAVGTAAGFVGLFGYLGRMAQAKGFGWMADHYGALHGAEVGWAAVIWSILACTAVGIALLAFTWRIRPRA
ncbi:MAG: MFS transporter [Deltaproteobacteria bacterium]|nr:MFS transporter [Deltaproteobacteria bacterium]